MNHIGLYLSNLVNKNFIIDRILSNEFLNEYIDLSEMHGELFSTITIEKIIDEELRHDKFPIYTNENATLQSMSSGQQRKALLTYLVAQKPQYIVLDDIYSSVDTETLSFVLETLNKLSQSTLVIQLFYRRHDVLPYIKNVY